MTAAAIQPLARSSGSASTRGLGIAELVLIRVASGGATRADLQRDLAQVAAPRINGTEFRRAAELAISTYCGRDLITEARGRLNATPAGVSAAAALLAPSKLAAGWQDTRDALVLKAIGASPGPSAVKATQRIESLAALVLQRHFEMPGARVLSPADLRAALAILALERAFGNKIKTGLAKGAGLPAKAGRVLAAQLFANPREHSTDGKLILALAAEKLGAAEATIDAFKLAALRRLAAPPEEDEAPVEPRARERKPKVEAPEPDNDFSPLTLAPAPSYSPPDLAEFCSAVLAAARPVAEGWPGNRKAFISLVWKAIRQTRPGWGLSEIAFKGMLAEAHRAGHVELVGADLKEGRDPQALEDSRILYKNAVWHFVRVED